MPEPINLADYVRESFDGVVGDELGRLDYFGSDTQRDNDQAQAADLIAADLARRFGRGLTRSEMLQLVTQVACEWQRQKELAGERAFDREQGQLWSGVDMTLNAGND